QAEFVEEGVDEHLLGEGTPPSPRGPLAHDLLGLHQAPRFLAGSGGVSGVTHPRRSNSRSSRAISFLASLPRKLSGPLPSRLRRAAWRSSASCRRSSARSRCSRGVGSPSGGRAVGGSACGAFFLVRCFAFVSVTACSRISGGVFCGQLP